MLYWYKSTNTDEAAAAVAGFGTVMGHEFSHGFDGQQGSRYEQHAPLIEPYKRLNRALQAT